MIPTCQHCLSWRAHNFTAGICWQHGGVRTGADETCSEFTDRLVSRPVERSQADGWTESVEEQS